MRNWGAIFRQFQMLDPNCMKTPIMVARLLVSARQLRSYMYNQTAIYI